MLFPLGRDQDREIYADFVVQPLTPYKKGVRQMVRVISASNLVVVENGKIVLQRRLFRSRTSTPAYRRQQSHFIAILQRRVPLREFLVHG